MYMVAIFSGPAEFTITSVNIGPDRGLISVSYEQVSHVTVHCYASALYIVMFRRNFVCSDTALVWPLIQNEPDCPGYPSERYTVDIDGVQVADLRADEFQSLTTNHSNGSVTLFLPLTQRLSEEAVTMNMTKFNTVPTNMSDDMGNTVTEMVTWRTSAVFSEL